jgi:ribosomal protein S18 acetylase RimI-like enzyme
MERTVVRPARLVDLPGAAAVLQEAFSDKMRIIFSKQPEKVRALLEEVYTGPVGRGYDGILVAERGGRIIGTLLVEPIYYTPRENRAFENFAIRELGMLRMLRAAFLLWLVGYRPKPGEAYISDVGVAQDHQGQGVGQLLIEQAEEWARDHNRERMTLWVAATNERAVHVYEKAGFTINRTRSNLILGAVFGIQRWHFMEKPLKTTVFSK